MSKTSERSFGKANARVERRQGAVRQHIIDAAVRAFARHGFEAATMRDVAQEAGYTAASLYTYFRSKQEIAEALMQSVAEEFLGSYDLPLPVGLELHQKLELLLHQQFLLAERRRDAFTVFIGVEHAPWAPIPGDEERVPGLLRFVERLKEWLRETGAAELGHDLDDMAHAFFGIAHGFVLRWMYRPEAGLARHARLIVHLFLHGVASLDRPARLLAASATPSGTVTRKRRPAGGGRAARRTRSSSR